jgi:uncharacterized protein (TIGR02611 family)
MMSRLHQRKALHKQRSRLYRIAVGAAGVLLILVGLVLAVPGVPGPGLLIVALGVGLLALEFDRAERLLDRILHRLEQVGQATTKASRPQKVLIGAAVVAVGVAALAAVLFLDLPFVPL